jgi:predicted transcriptional regulator
MAQVCRAFKGFISEKKILSLCQNDKDKVQTLLDRGFIQPQKNSLAYEVTEKGWHWFSKNQERLMAMPFILA